EGEKRAEGGRSAQGRRLCRARHDGERRHAAARRQGGRRRALLRTCAGAGMGGTSMTGRLFVIGLGPGDPALITPEATAAVRTARELFGYKPYIERVGPVEG